MLWTQAVDELLKARDISDEDGWGIIVDLLLRRYFVLDGGNVKREIHLI